MGSAQGTTTETTRAGPSIIDLSSGEELVALHLGENEHKRRRDSTCSVSSNSFQDTYPRSGGPSTTTTTTTTESLREVFDVQDDGTLLPVWDHAPAMPSQKKKVKLDGRAASPLRSLEHDQDFVAQNMSNGWRGGHGANDDDDDDDAIGHDSTVFGSKAGGYFRRFSTTTTTTGHGLSSPLDTSSASPRPMDMGPYRDGSSTTNRHDSWRHHHRPGQSRYSAEQDGWLGDDETPSQHHHHNVNNDHSRPKTGSSAKKVEGNWALVKHSGTRVSLVSGVDELLKSHPTSCLNTINDNSTSSSSSTSAHQQLVLYRRPPLYAAAMVEELDEEDEEDEKRAAVETVRGRHRHRRSTGVVIEEIGDDDEGALADDEHSTRPRRGGARIHELDADDDLEMDAEDEQEEGEGDLTAPRSHNRIVPSDFNTDQAVHDIEAQIMSMDLD
ncbi:hypothetical protein DFQ27_000075 [Actinomortierella ambigua]|uniref:Uncharacterized protein n=1 Tax=Actinomortierella ambigua TaxID=1343610 RepID=A0A9P6UC30_9FUNG|nr:hypothetical protein DFQ27_000075 [Actinomortierella ambigua]